MWGWKFKVITYHLVVAVGLVVNSLTFIVMKTPRLKPKSYSHYLSALAVFDSLVLISQEIHIIDEILIRSFHQNGLFHGFSDEACKILNFSDSVCNLMSAWLIVVMALERLWVVCMPFARTGTMWFRQKGAVIIILSLLAVMSATQIFRLGMVGKTGSTCMGSGPMYVSLHVYLYQFVLHSTAPILIVFLANVGVVAQIVSVERATHVEECSSTRLTRGDSRRRSKTTRMMVYISLTYILTSIPLVSLTIFLHVLATKYGNAASGIFIRSLPWLEVLQVLASINYDSNFFIYILSGKKFRIELGQLLSCKQNRDHQVTSVNTRSGSVSVRTRDEILLTNI
ncbi:p2Y purinoceptor 4 [Elysia marginata]|uniref:P2Y purinoceptor 4 n=1 Tax=Elysia marginata TaxID=1093978 RepID=A0AAV4HUS7_9GAST|nr:p2Y purinoceptor 4 [Elysia marginata]